MFSLARRFVGAALLAASLAAFSQGCAPAAKLVIGQPDFTSGGENRGKETAVMNSFFTPAGPVAFHDDAFFIADSWNDRVLKFSPVPTQNDPSAAAVIRSSDPAKWLNLNRPYSVAVAADGKTAVADMENNRVLLWNAVPAGDETPDVVLGQADLTSPPVADCAHLSEPRFVSFGGGKFIISDWDNNRILIWNSVPAQTPATGTVAADLVLGNPDCSADETASTRHTFNHPRGVWTDGTRLVVADKDNHRILIWSRFPTRATDDADIILGTGKPGAGKERLNGPYSVASDGTRLFVSEMDNNRVLMWNTFPVRDGEAPSALFGQSSYARGGQNGAKKDAERPGKPSARVMNHPQGVAYRDHELWVTDTDNNRILMFEVK